MRGQLVIFTSMAMLVLAASLASVKALGQESRHFGLTSPSKRQAWQSLVETETNNSRLFTGELLPEDFEPTTLQYLVITVAVILLVIASLLVLIRRRGKKMC